MAEAGVGKIRLFNDFFGVGDPDALTADSNNLGDFYLGGDTLRQGLREEIPAAYAMQFTMYQLPEVIVLLLPAAFLPRNTVSPGFSSSSVFSWFLMLVSVSFERRIG